MTELSSQAPFKPSPFALSPKALSRFESPANAGRPASADFRLGLFVGPERAFAIWAALGPDGRVGRAFFKAHASPSGIACASLAAELLIGSDPALAQAPDPQRLLMELELSAESLPEALGAADAAGRALAALRRAD